MRSAVVRLKRNVLRYTSRRSAGINPSPMICDAAVSSSLSKMARNIARWVSSSVGIDALLPHVCHRALRLGGFIEQNIECRNIRVPFDQCGHGPKPRQCLAIKRPDFWTHPRAVIVDAERAAADLLDGMSRKMDFTDCSFWKGGEVGRCIPAVVASADIN